jgi:Spy/CpxP family protein refolding chaperone
MLRPTTRSTTITALSVASMLLLTACGGSDAPSAEKNSPLEAFFEDVVGDWDSDEQQKKWEEQNRKAEELIAECMAEQGFEYIPVEQSGGVTVSADEEEHDPEKYAAENGYGMSVQPEMTPEQEEEMNSFVDPNQAYVEAMSETEMNAYNTALHGESFNMEPDENGEMPEIDMSQMGCWGTAQNEASGGEQELYESEDMQAFNDATTKLYEDIPKDARMTEVLSKCMADAGFDQESPELAMEHFMNASNELYSGDNPEGPDEAELKALQELEKDTAVADLDCQKKTKYQDVHRSVQIDLEQKFVDENTDLLERVRSAYAELKK